MTAPIDPRDEVFTLAEAARFLRMSERWVRASDVPRARLGERRIVYLCSQLIAHVTRNLSHRIDAEPTPPRRRP